MKSKHDTYYTYLHTRILKIKTKIYGLIGGKIIAVQSNPDITDTDITDSRYNGLGLVCSI